jgi:glycosyltransferase involved in cell wall biosynthesis
MRVCLLCYRGKAYSGGQGVYLYYLAKELLNQGHDVHVIAGPPYPECVPGVTLHKMESLRLYETSDDSPDLDRPERPPSRRHPLKFSEWGATKVGLFPEIFTFSMRAYWKLRELQPKYKFDVVHDNQCLGHGIWLIKSLGIPVVATIHHPVPIDREHHLKQARTWQEKWKKMRFYAFCTTQKLVAPRLDRIINVSQASKDECQSIFKVPDSKIRIVLNGVDTDMFRKSNGAQPEPNSLVMVGSTEDRKKGVLYLLQALRILNHEMNMKVNLTLVDRKPPGLLYAPSLVKEYGLESQVSYSGRLSTEELVHEYQKAEVCVIPSIYEGFGFPAAEAMSCETPLVTSRAGALPEVTGDPAEGALLVPPEDPYAIANAVRSILSDDELKISLGKAGRKRIEERFTWAEATRQTVEVYEEVAKC